MGWAPCPIHEADSLGMRSAQVSKVAELDKWQLYLVDWGYNTEAERRRADADPRITLLSKEDFLALTSA